MPRGFVVHGLWPQFERGYPDFCQTPAPYVPDATLPGPAAIRFAHVNSSHHQTLDRLGAGLVVEARHAGDGVVEQVRLRDYPFALGVQYHPERDSLYRPLFDSFAARILGTDTN